MDINIECDLFPPNNLRKIIEQKTTIKRFCLKTKIPERSLRRMYTKNVLSQEPAYYLKLEEELSCDFIDLYFANGKQVFEYQIKVLIQIEKAFDHVKQFINKEYLSRSEFINVFYDNYSIFGCEIFVLLKNIMDKDYIFDSFDEVNYKLKHLIATARKTQFNVLTYRVELLIDYIKVRIKQQIKWFKTNYDLQPFLTDQSCFKEAKNYLYAREDVVISSKRMKEIFSQMVIHNINYWFNQLD